MPREGHGRTTEGEIAIAALRIAASRLGGTVSTGDLKKEIPSLFKLTPADLKPSPSRPNERKWHQIVGNIISHRNSSRNIIGNGYARYTGSGIEITNAGRKLLKDLGYDE